MAEQGGRVLVVDDDEAMRCALTKTLARAGYEVCTAQDGEEAEEILAQRPVDLVITDIVMPHKDGAEMLMDLRRDYPALKVIAISGDHGHFGPQMRLEFAEVLGAMRTFTKPLHMSELMAAVDDLLALDAPV